MSLLQVQYYNKGGWKGAENRVINLQTIFTKYDLIIFMFSKLKKQININNKSPKLSPKFTPKAKSYTEICLDNNRNYQITWIADHLFQGSFDKHKNKHGEGVLIMDNGITVIGSWNQGKIHGNALIITPFAALIYANFCQGRLDGWVISKYKKNIEIEHFTENKSTQNVKLIYEGFEGLWVKSKYDERKFSKVIKLERAKELELPSFNEDQELAKIFKLIFKYKKYSLNLKKIGQFRLDHKFYYYGYVDRNLLPSGLGVLHSDNEVYMGNFQNGILHKYGLILFDTGTVYKGDINKGKLKGQGIFFSPIAHESRLVRIQQDEVDCIIEEKEGFLIENYPFPFTIGKTKIYNQTPGFPLSVNDLCEEISRFYYRQHSFDGQEEEEQDNFEENEDSLDIDHVQIAESPKALSNFGSYESKPSTIKSRKKVQPLSLKKVLTYEQIIKRQIKRVDYPHLKQFQLSPTKKNNLVYRNGRSPKINQRPGTIKTQVQY